MASSDHPETPPASADTPATTSIQTSAPTPDAPAIPLPPPPKPSMPSVENFTRLCGRLDGSLVVLVLVFAFLVASFPVTNPDFFGQLATGRLLAHGDYHFGVDPFTYSSDGTYWVNHSWLFALMVYALYQIPVIGGAAVVVCKALLVTVLAAILLRSSRRAGQSLWIPAACTALAILAISTRFYLQPFYLSFLFLALTLWLLTAVRYPLSAVRKQAADSGQRIADSGQRLWWLLPPLFALWVNCDQWFFLGPLVVALYLIGGLLQQWFPLSEEKPEEMRPRELIRLALVLIVGLAACLLNPHHLHAFTLPAVFGLSPAHNEIQHDAQFRGLFLSPLRKGYYEPYLGLSVAGLAYLPLLLLGLISFVCLFGRATWQRLLIWLAFALLSLYSARAIPLFAVMAGPITALNWLDYAAHRLGRAPRLTPGWRRWSLGGRVLTILLAVALLVATVPGWLQSQPYQTHRVGWRVVVDPSLQEAALQIKNWREQNRLPADVHWFNMHNEVANYLVWFAPGERAFIDQRLTQFPKAAREYQAIRASLERMVPDENAAREGSEAAALAIGKKDWQSILRDQGVQFWIMDHANSQKADLIAQTVLFGNPDEWKLCYLEGRIAIFAWKDARKKDAPDPASGLELDLKRLAFGPQAKQAPPRGPEVPAPRNEWWYEGWDAWWQPNPPPSLDKSTATLQEVRFLVMQPRFLHQNAQAWQTAVATSAIGVSLPFGPIPNSLLAFSWSCTYDDLFPTGALQPRRQALPREGEALKARAIHVNAQDAGPPESLYLGIRAARRALRTNPKDPQTYLLLGHAYARLDERTQERFLKRFFPGMAEIRRTQMVAAYQNCLRFNPRPMNAVEAHEALFKTFRQLGYLDVAANHLRGELKSLKEMGPLPGQPPAKHAQALDGLSKQLTSLDDQVKRKLDNYEVTSANKPVMEKVQMALDRGLAEKALSVLNEAPDLGSLGGLKELTTAERMMALMLDLGQLDTARDQLLPKPDMVGQPVSPQHLSFHVRLAAARGDYEEADRHLADGLNHAWEPPLGQQLARDPRREIAETVGRVLLASQRLEMLRVTGMPRLPTLGQPPSDFWVRRWRLQAIETGIAVEGQRAGEYLKRGWLALEAGRCVEARRHFQTVLELVIPQERWIPEVQRLDAIVDLREIQGLQQLNLGQNLARNWAQHYLKWLDAYQR
ncbi:MAG TPA: hypothetical protein VN688_04160 [Gemmataceae bacterium]|nr:hypothetical protein [Gemmataceae bacterium]